jgi:parallel beta-helix repeat protein
MTERALSTTVFGQRNQRGTLALVVMAAFALVLASPAVSRSMAKQLVVDKDKVQCPKANYTSIQAAIDAAAPGDTIKVCPDQYNESVNVTKPSLTLVGPTTVNVGQCSTVTAANPTEDAIVTGAGSYSFSLLNNNITLSGFVVQGSADGIDTSGSYSGYRVTNNIAENNTDQGINLNSSGTNESRVDHNCLRLNAYGLASWIGDLRNALVDHNAAYRNGHGLQFTGVGARAYVTVTGNSTVENVRGYSIDNSIGSSIDHNTSQGDNFGIYVGGANNGLKISANVLQGNAGNGIRFDQSGFSPVFTDPNVGLDVGGNSVSGAGGSGIVADGGAPNLTLSLLSNNDSSRNGNSGIRLQASNDNNTVSNNSTDKNGNIGIWAELAAGNTFTNKPHVAQRRLRRERRQPASEHLDGQPVHHRLPSQDDLQRLTVGPPASRKSDFTGKSKGA